MNTLGSRIKKIRELEGLTQQEFADRLGTPRSNIGGYEKNARNPSDAVISSICREFNINDIWLRTGEGDIHRPVSRNAAIEAFMDDVMHSESEDFRRRLVDVLSRLNSDEWKLLEQMALKLAAEAQPKPQLQIVKKAGRDGSFTETAMTGEEIEKLKAELDSYPDASYDL